MTHRNITGAGRRIVRTLGAFAFLVLAADGAGAEGLRNIAAVNVANYFDGDYRMTIEDVFLVRFSPAFSLQVRASRFDRPGDYEHVLWAGPVINLSETVYVDAIYGLGFNSDWRATHRGDINLNYETEDVSFSIGTRGTYVAGDDYYYIIPSIGAKIRIAPWFALFSKLFLSWDSLNVFSGSYWGELYWITGEAVTIRTGGTVSWAGEWGYSLIAGVDLRFSPVVLLRYSFKFLSNTMDYEAAPATVFGVENGIILDVTF